MRNSIRVLALIAVLSCPTLAGEVNTPGKTEPPPCTNCATPAPDTEPVGITEAIKLLVVEIALIIIKK